MGVEYYSDGFEKINIFFIGAYFLFAIPFYFMKPWLVGFIITGVFGLMGIFFLIFIIKFTTKKISVINGNIICIPGSSKPFDTLDSYRFTERGQGGNWIGFCITKGNIAKIEYPAAKPAGLASGTVWLPLSSKKEKSLLIRLKKPLVPDKNSRHAGEKIGQVYVSVSNPEKLIKRLGF